MSKSWTGKREADILRNGLSSSDWTGGSGTKGGLRGGGGAYESHRRKKVQQQLSTGGRSAPAEIIVAEGRKRLFRRKNTGEFKEKGKEKPELKKGNTKQFYMGSWWGGKH